MPKQKDLKRVIRTRMRKTGESYTAARARVLEKRPPSKSRSPARSPAGSPARSNGQAQANLAELAGMSDAALAANTGRDWKAWVAVLDRAGAAKMEHGAIARLVREEHGVPSWWSQAVTVGYERIRGLRQRGQRRDGSFEVSKSKVYPVPVARLWTAFLRCDRWLDGEKLRMSKATKHKCMRMRWSDGTPVEAYFVEKGPSKSQLSVQHRQLASRADADRLRAFWTERVARIGALLAQEKK